MFFRIKKHIVLDIFAEIINNNMMKDYLKNIWEFSRLKAKKINFYRLIFVLIIILLLFAPGTFLFKIPETEIISDLVKIDSENVHVKTSILISNKNPYKLKISDLSIRVYASDGLLTDTFKIKGGNIRGNSKEEFSSEFSMNLSGVDEGFLKINISGSAGIVLLGFIKKEMPLSFVIKTNTVNAIESINAPDVNININILKLQNDGIYYSGDINIYNKNNILISVNSLKLEMKTLNENLLTDVNITGSAIQPATTGIFRFSGIIPYKLIDSQFLIADFVGLVTLKAAGVEKKIPLKTRAALSIPQLNILTGLNNPFSMRFSSSMDIGLRTADLTVYYTMINPGDVVMNAKNIKIEILKFDNNSEVTVDSQVLPDIKINALDTLTGSFKSTIPVSSISSDSLFKIFPDKYIMKLNCDLSIFSFSQSIPYELIIDIDPKIF